MAKRAGGSRASRPKGDRAAHPAGATDREHVLAAEAADEIAAYALPGDAGAIAGVIEEHSEAPDDEPAKAERDQHTEDAVTNVAEAVRILRRFIEKHDEDEKPFVRVVGRIIYMLTVEGGRGSCTVTPIAVALLLFLQEHLDPIHRQRGNTRQTINVTATNLQGLLYDRIGRLASEKWMMLRKEATGRGYQLTTDGRFVFNGWPKGIAFDPHDKNLWTRKKPDTRGKPSVPLPAK
jgi:hypothetical protein